MDENENSQTLSDSTNKMLSLLCENVLQNALTMTEVGMDLRERCIIGEKYLAHLKMLFCQANHTLLALQTASRSSLLQAKKLLSSTQEIVLNSNPDIKHECDKLLGLVQKQLGNWEEMKISNTELFENEPSTLPYITEKIKFLENKVKTSENNLPPSTSSTKSIKSDVDEKYPESWSRDSSIDLGTVVNLPSVPEDVFTSFTSSRPKRSSSLSSLKSMRKVKLFLQRAETSDEEDISSDADDQDGQKGDSDDGSNPGKKFLGNIKEEMPDTQF